MTRSFAAGVCILAAVIAASALWRAASSAETPVAAISDEEFARRRHELVDTAIAPVIADTTVVAAMRKVPRHLFVPAELRADAYANEPLPIGHEQTISQPFIVALMTQLCRTTSKSRVLEIGTGSGYQAAVLAEVAGEVYSIEIVEPLGKRAAKDLKDAGYDRIHLRIGDGYLGWPEAAPFDAILVTCAPENVPTPLQEQLAEGGRLVIPVGEEGDQDLVVVEKKNGALVKKEIVPVRFVPMTGKAETEHDDAAKKPEKPRTRLN